MRQKYSIPYGRVLNKEIIANSDKKGLSIERETWLLEKIVELRKL